MSTGSNNKTRKPSPRAQTPISIESSSGNVFADLDIPNPDLALVKARLVQRIRQLIDERKLTQVKAATLLGLDQPKVSALVRGRVEGFTIDRLIRSLNALGQQIEISFKPMKQTSV